MRTILPLAIIILVYILTGIIFLYGFKKQIISKNKFWRMIFVWSDLLISATIILVLLILYFIIRSSPNFISLTRIFYAISFFLLFYIPKLLFVILFIFNELIKFLINAVLIKNVKFRILTFLGFIISIFTFITIVYGIIAGKNDFTVRNTEIYTDKIPKSFDKLKIVQISDIHIGSFYYNSDKLTKIVKIINNLNPDIVLFTGDLVNNFAEEADGFDSIFLKIKAPLGKFAVLGNHDYGDYTVWPTPEIKNINLSKIIFHYKAMGFNLLQNRSVIISNGKDSITIAGVDNWGLPPFRQYGDLQKTVENVSSRSFTIMLSHDPSYWNEEIQYSKKVDITFSGHTHGGQVGFEKFGIKWNLVKYRYPQCAGLYQNNQNYLYVNRGLGCIGFIGRIGIPPEITLIIIHKK
ncbi:MAG: hypothetical protein COX07_07655 [Bacteroidetes bacterium CG23_combo_of_CG06-09_8_20_14_all_32_9]|nr:MAG: hypothetical protein COX07_07655 [Bacteroidetes bacterium CG23_combo_of_CG06-09_8_20_14_all_32_9]